MQMHFDYEISPEDYFHGQVLYNKLTGGKKRVFHAIFSILVGAFFLILAWNEQHLDWAHIVLGFIGVWQIYLGLANIFPLLLLKNHFARAYCKTDLNGQKFSAEINEKGLFLTGKFASWTAKWEGIRLKGEDSQVFTFISGSALFIFGKKYLNDEQEQQMKMLAGLSTKSHEVLVEKS